jgi:hypothetical protein
LTQYSQPRRKKSAPPKDYLKRLRRQQPRPISAATARALHDANRGERQSHVRRSKCPVEALRPRAGIGRDECVEKSHERGLAGNAAWSARDSRRHLPRGVSKIISAEALSDAIASFDEDLAEGRYVDDDILWRATLRRAQELSRAHTPALGCRTSMYSTLRPL